MDLGEIKKGIPELVKTIEEHSNHRIPKANQKNIYTQACWILAIWQGIYLRNISILKSEAESKEFKKFTEQIKVLKNNLHLIKEII